MSLNIIPNPNISKKREATKQNPEQINENQNITKIEPLIAKLKALGFFKEYHEQFESVAVKQQPEENVESFDLRILTKEEKSKARKAFFETKNAVEIVNLAKKFEKDISKETKNAFGFYEPNSTVSNELIKTVAGLSHYFVKTTGLSPIVVTNKPECFLALFNSPDTYEHDVFLGEQFDRLPIIRFNGVNIVSIQSIVTCHENSQNKDFKELIEAICGIGDLSLWEIPDWGVIETESEVYIPCLEAIDHISLVVEIGFSNFRSIEKTIKYFNQSNVKIKGVISSAESNSSKRGQK